MFLCGRSRYRRFARLVLGTSFALWLLVWALQHYGEYTGQYTRSLEHSMAKMDIGELNEKAANSKENARVREKEEVSEMKAEVVFLADEAAAIKEGPVKEDVKEELLIKEETIAKKKEIPARKEETASVQKEASAQNKDLLSKQEEPRPVQMEASDEKNEVPAKKEAAPSKQGQGKEEEAPEKKQEAPSKKDKVSPEANGVPTKKEATAKKNELAENKDEVAAKNDEPQGKKEESLTMKEKVPAKKEGVPTSTQNVPSRTSTPLMTIIPPEMNSSYIGDTYFQEDKRLHTTDCPSSIMKKMVGSDFQSIYLEKLPLLQWAPHATLEEYTRLRRYNGCFGWDVISWDYLKQTLSLLNTSANGYMFSDWNWKPKAGSPCIRCAVVGNGGILNGSKKGKEIDEHDYVFRVNGAILDDYVEDVGNRTSFYFFSVNTMMNSFYNYEIDGFHSIPQSKKVSYVLIPDNGRDYYMAKAALTGRHVDQGEENGTLPSTLFGESYTTEQFKIMHPDFMRYLRNRFLLSSTLGTTMRDIYRPSSGATMLLTAIHSCDEVSAYGFITPDYEKYSNHYYDKTKKEVFFYLNHDYDIEMQLWQTLYEQGIIKLYTRS